MPSAFELRQPWPSDFLKIWKRRRSSSISSWLQLGSTMAICYPGSSIWMKPPCDLSFHWAEPLNSVAAEPFQWSPVVPRRGALQWHSQSPLMAANYHLQWSSKEYAHPETSLLQTLFVYGSTRRAGWMRKVNYCLFLSLLQSLLYSDNWFSEAYSTLRNETKQNEMVLCETVLCEMVVCETVLCETVTTQCLMISHWKLKICKDKPGANFPVKSVS